MNTIFHTTAKRVPAILIRVQNSEDAHWQRARDTDVFAAGSVGIPWPLTEATRA
jgi:hypothetical protein